MKVAESSSDISQIKAAGCVWFVGLAIIALLLAFSVRFLKARITALEDRVQTLEQKR